MTTTRFTPIPAKITRKERIGSDVVRLSLRPREVSQFVQAAPGQYVMLWVPHAPGCPSDSGESDMLPFSVAGIDGDDVILIVRAAGKTTNSLIEFEEGDDVGMTPPRGNGFSIPRDGLALCVAGGVGLAPLLFLRRELDGCGVGTSFIFGAKNKSGLLGFDCEPGFTCVTEDGSYGTKGMVTDILASHWDGVDDKGTFSSLFCCGPEVMMKNVLDFAVERDIDAQFSLERHFYCASGVCGFCEVGGRRVCIEGPVFTARQLAGVTDFGVRHRDASGVFRQF